jgi:hypothetical protein
MQGWARRLQAIGDVVTFDYPYMRKGMKKPDPPAILIAAHREALADARHAHGAERPVVLVGKSLGSRMGCHLAVELEAEGQPPLAIACFGYPLRAAASREMRDQVLRALATPVLFIQGSRDPLCDLGELDEVRRAMTATSEVMVIDGGDHSCEVGVRTLAAQGRSQESWNEAALAKLGDFVSRARA